MEPAVVGEDGEIGVAVVIETLSTGFTQRRKGAQRALRLFYNLCVFALLGVLCEKLLKQFSTCPLDTLKLSNLKRKLILVI